MALVGALWAVWARGPLSRERRLMREGDEVVAAIERHRHATGRLPESLRAVGLPEAEEGPIHYERRGDGGYVLWFGTVLGESATYDSRTGRWDAARD